MTTGEDGRITAREPVDPAFPRRIVRPWAADLDAFPTEQGIITEGTELGGNVPHGGQPGVWSGLPFLRRRLLSADPSGSGAPRRLSLPSGGASKRENDRPSGDSRLGPSGPPSPLPLHPGTGGKVAVGSLRIDRISAEMMALLKETGVETISLAPRPAPSVSGM